MKPIITAALAAAACFAFQGAASAACSNETTASIAGGTGEAISKDGQHTPLETDANAPGVTQSQGGTTTNMEQAEASASGAVSKDGSTMPLAETKGGGDVAVAMSDQDVAAQQNGDPTAAATAQQETCTN
ncbi:hypothetical protein [Antarcticirhabdus aurantiaca]|uniref:Uncharacterized protein n=1 Tax=Antarcticirhabdus aurantiaca TaxID=2606717 RepID=A0ACD4NLL3_9HYPH|nr:hypothetical protein [Antarcticirhabdus aurantiaca]WAJ27511.1 hypothetical protein OXU80_22120 [Jeongeuplla avenae]